MRKLVRYRFTLLFAIAGLLIWAVYQSSTAEYDILIADIMLALVFAMIWRFHDVRRREANKR